MLELKNISVGYGKKSVLTDITVSFEKEKLTSIIGINGCGKSTLLKAVLGILPLSCGQIFIDGTDMHSLSRIETAKRIAYLPQCKSIPDMTVGQMVLHGRFPYLCYPRQYKKSDREIAQNAMDSVGIAHFADKQMYELSAGMRQTAYIAMALAQDTDYILLDEPTTYLDISHQLELVSLLSKLTASGKGIIAVMHDLPLAFNFSDTVTAIHNGKILAHSTPKEICAASITKEIFGIEMMQMTDDKF